jgi:hypothetical protein
MCFPLIQVPLHLLIKILTSTVRSEVKDVLDFVDD